MRFVFPWWVPFVVLLTAGAAAMKAQESPPDRTVTHSWKPMADWYRPGIRIAALAPRTVEQSELRYHVGDDPSWAAPQLDDAGWAVIERRDVPTQSGIFWLRLRVRSTLPHETIPSLVLIGQAAAHDLYWDGELISSLGRPGNRAEEEVAGANRVQVHLSPKAAAPGEHVVALRMSTYRRAKAGATSTPLMLWTVDPAAFDALDRTSNMLCAMGMGAMLTLGLSIFVLWILDPKRVVLLLISLLCFAAAGLVAVSAAPAMFYYPAAWIYWQSQARVALVAVVTSLLVAIVMKHFHPGRSRWLAVPFVVEAAAAWWCLPLGPDAPMILWRIGLYAALLVAAAAVWRRRDGAGWVLAGAGLALFVFERDPRHYDSTRFLFGFLPLVVGLVAAIGTTVRRERIAAQQTKLTAARLEIELLRKSLQPHFLLNTLTALAQVIEEKPVAAIRLIEDVAAELRTLNRLSSEKTVSLADELALCRCHLRVMSARTDRTWTLLAEGVDLDAAVPPAIFLTLIENGFSHQRVQAAAAAFRLTGERAGKAMRYTFLSPGNVVANGHASGGTGLRYVRSRLDESFHGAWTLRQHAAADGWETVIELGDATALSPLP